MAKRGMSSGGTLRPPSINERGFSVKVPDPTPERTATRKANEEAREAANKAKGTEGKQYKHSMKASIGRNAQAEGKAAELAAEKAIHPVALSRMTPEQFAAIGSKAKAKVHLEGMVEGYHTKRLTAAEHSAYKFNIKELIKRHNLALPESLKDEEWRTAEANVATKNAEFAKARGERSGSFTNSKAVSKAMSALEDAQRKLWAIEAEWKS